MKVLGIESSCDETGIAVYDTRTDPHRDTRTDPDLDGKHRSARHRDTRTDPERNRPIPQQREKYDLAKTKVDR